VSARLGIPAVSTGDIFRRNVAAGTPLGVEAKRYLDAGEYVPDSVTNAMVRDRLAEPDAKPGFLLDGYPRTTAQVAELDDAVQPLPAHREHVVELVVPEDELVARLVGRALEEGRSDDTEAVVRRRQELYLEETAPLAHRYAERGLLRRVDGLGDLDAVTKRVLAALEE